MKFLNHIFSVISAILVIPSVLVLSQLQAFSFDLSLYLPYHVGDVAYYLSTEEDDATDTFKEHILTTVQFGEKQAYVFGELDTGCWSFDGWAEAWDSEGLKYFGDADCDNGEAETTLFDPPIMNFPRHMNIGESREWTYNGMNLQGSVLGFESVSVPAGIFNSLRVQWQFIEIDESEICDTWLVESLGKIKEVCLNQENGRKETEIIELIAAVVDGELTGNPLQNGEDVSFDLATATASGCSMLVKNIVLQGQSGPELWWAGFVFDLDSAKWILHNAGQGTEGHMPNVQCEIISFSDSLPTIKTIEEITETRLAMLVPFQEQLIRAMFGLNMETLSWDLITAEFNE